MFKDFQVEKYLDYDKNTNTYRYQVLIIDDNFSESIPAGASATEQTAGAAAAIEIYSSLNLKVAHNLYLLCRKVNERYGWSIESQIEYYSKYIEKFLQYKEEVLQYHYRYLNQKAFW